MAEVLQRARADRVITIPRRLAKKHETSLNFWSKRREAN